MAEPKDQEQMYIPSASDQREASNAWAMAQAQLKNAEKMYADATGDMLRASGLKAVQAAQEEIGRVKAKWGRVLDWQKAEADKAAKAASSAASSAGVTLGEAAQKTGDVLGHIGDAGASAMGAAGQAMGAAGQAMKSEAAQVKKHIVQKGESLSLIAKHYTGDVHKWKELYEKNKAVVGNNPDLIQPGMELILPW